MGDAPLRLLWVTPSVPDHDGGGDQIRQAALLTRLGGTFAVHLVAPDVPVDAAVRRATGRVTTYDPRPPRRLLPPRLERLLHAAVARDPQVVRQAARTVARLRRVVRRHAATSDVVLVEHLEFARCFDRRVDATWAITMHLAHSRHDAHLAAVTAGRRRWFWQREQRKAARLEGWVGSRYDVVLACSEQDAVSLSGPVTRVPNGVDVTEIASPLPSAPRIVFTGSLDFAPNVDGLLWFLQEVWPLVRAEQPRATLEVVGRRPGVAVTSAATRTAGVTLHADVPTVAEHLDRARIAVVPIRVGGGTRLKALQALAAGRVVVGTSVGLEGLDLVDGEHALVADDPRSFAAAVVGAITADHLADRLARQGRAHVAAHFGWDACADRLRDALVSVAQRTRSVTSVKS